MITIKKLDSEELIHRLRSLVKSERKITSEVIEYVEEMDARKLYLEFGYTNSFSFLTRELGYSESAAMRRINAARFSRQIPEIKEAIEDGSLNLSQVSLLASSIRAKQKEDPSNEVAIEERKEILEKLKSKDLKTSEKIIAKELDLPVQVKEKKHFQKDNSVRLEITLSEEQMRDLERVKELISHQNPNPTFAELVSFLAGAFLKSKEPKLFNKVTAAAVGGVRQGGGESKRFVNHSSSKQNEIFKNKPKLRPHIPKHIRYKIFQRDRFCQWRDPRTGQICASRFQLQIDHRKPIWAGGGSEVGNLQLLCSTHNLLKFEREMINNSSIKMSNGESHLVSH